MSQKSLPQRQLFTVRQIVAALGILACVAFVVSYSSRILVGINTQAELQRMEESAEALAARQAEIQALLAEVDDPRVVEDYARNEQNWIQEGDQPLATLHLPAPAEEAPANERVVPAPRAREPSHWQEWWDLLAPAP